MSGICGIVHAGGAPVPREEIESLADGLRARGPDGLGIWVGEGVALGHALLRCDARARRPEPLSLDGRVWITSDARIDDIAGLRAALAARGRQVSDEAGDAELILHAYAEWGEACPEHLLGDFAFAVWDAPRRRLFCARDPLGVKPFFYARLGDAFVFCNTLNGVRRSPRVSSRLDDLAIADALAFEMSLDPARTAFEDIARLPAAHALTIGPGGLAIRQYWSLPSEARIAHRDPREHVEEFAELMRRAVSDRLRGGGAAIHMSGGLDSPSLAATALRCSGGSGGDAGLRAHTVVYDRLFPDDERHFATVAARALGIPIDFHAADDYRLYERRAEIAAFFPEPIHNPLAALEVDLARRGAAHSRVILTGYDGDTLLDESPRPYFRLLWRERRLWRWTRCVASYAFAERRRLPRSVLRRALGRTKAASARGGTLPAWIAPDLARRFDLLARAARRPDIRKGAHPSRPRATGLFSTLMGWADFFEAFDPGRTGAAVEYRHPLMDLRVVEFALSLPTYPWCLRKEILRRAARDLLPPPLLTRPKTPLRAYPHHEHLKGEYAQWLERFTPCEETRRYVDVSRIPSARSEPDPEQSWIHLRPLTLDLWLRQQAAGPP